MKRLIILPLLVLLTGCVSYYSPETALEDGVYYAEDDPAYVLNSSDYSGVVYYPWSSLDYFYLGYGRNYGYAFAYGYPYGWGYSPWGYPYGYHGYYSAWWPGPYNNRYIRQNHRETCQRNANCRWNDNDDSNVFYDGIARENGAGRHYGDNPDNVEEEPVPFSERKMARNRQAPVRRNGSLPRGRQYGTQDKVVRNNDKEKRAKSRLEPVKSVPATSVSVSPSPSSVTVHRPAASSPGASSRGSYRQTSASSSSGRRSTGQARPSRREDRN
ncbi:MAG: hypothetical protein OEU84_10030 [Xanthomonadales bacterium]|nr:hypothetical protein [Xanthomonadales bacterium]